MCAIMSSDDKGSGSYFLELCLVSKPAPIGNRLFNAAQIISVMATGDPSVCTLKSVPDVEASNIRVRATMAEIHEALRKTVGVAEKRSGVFSSGLFLFLHRKDVPQEISARFVNRHYISRIGQDDDGEAWLYHSENIESGPLRLRETYDEVKSLLMGPR